MFEVQSKIKRQVEILGLCLNNTDGKIFNTWDLAIMFGVEKLTIDRDLKDLREYGIDIHTTKKAGVYLTSELTHEKISECIAHYASINFPTVINEKATNLLVQKRGSAALKSVTLLQYCIENHISVIIVYNKKGDTAEKRIVDPVKMFLNEGAWRLLAKEKGRLKQFIIYKILSCEATNQRFKEIPASEYNSFFEYSWKSWLGEEKYEVKIKLSPKWADFIKSRVFTPHQNIYQNEQEEYIFEAVVNSLTEITTWVISLGEGAEVLQPLELKELVVNLAQGVLKNYPENEHFLLSPNSLLT